MIKKMTAAVLAGLISSQAMAHVGDHSEGSFMHMVWHFFSEPDHLLISIGAVALSWFAVSKLKKARMEK